MNKRTAQRYIYASLDLFSCEPAYDSCGH